MSKKHEKPKERRKQMEKWQWRKVISLILTLMLAIGCNTIQTDAATVSTSAGVQYKITSTAKKTAQAVKLADSTKTSISIPGTVKISGKTYKVVSIASNAFKECSKLKKVTIGTNMAKIGSKAFYGSKSLKTIIIKTTKLTKASVSSKAFGNINAKAIVTVPDSKLAEYKNILKDCGLNGKGQEVKSGDDGYLPSTKLKGSAKPIENYDPSQPLPDPVDYHFVLGNLSEQSAEYDFSDEIEFIAGMRMDQWLYGDWKMETIKKSHYFEQCFYCGRLFENDVMRSIHLDTCDGKTYDSKQQYTNGDITVFLDGRYIAGSTNKPYDAFVFYPDPDPCKVIYRFSLPDGLSYQKGSLKVKALCMDVPDGAYDLKVSGNQITVTVKDIKAKPYYYALNKARYDKNPYAYKRSNENETILSYINVLFSTKFNENVQATNTVTGSITYSYKGNTKTIDLGGRNVYSTSMKINHTDMDGNPLTGGTFTLYAEEPLVEEGSMYGTYEWKKIKSGLKSGDTVTGLGQNFYKLVQDTFPDGYKKYITPEFSVDIKDSGITALDNNTWTPLEVSNGVVQVVVKNKKLDGGSGQSTNVSAQTAVQDNKDTSGSVNTPNNPEPGTGAAPSDKKQSLKVVVTYYKDGVRESSMLYSNNESIATGMLNTKNISSRAYAFKGCVLLKTTLDDEEISKIPDYVKVGSTICFYYVTAGNN